MMEIVQLSDIHFGAQFREDVFAKVIDEVNSLDPSDLEQYRPKKSKKKEKVVRKVPVESSYDDDDIESLEKALLE